MVDVVDKAARSRMMSGIKGANTKPEQIIRQGLHGLGLRYRLHVSGLPGRPDMVFRKYNAVVFVHGCFWHGHECTLFRLPSTNTDFWRDKIGKNRARDRLQIDLLRKAGWRACIVWECAIRGADKRVDVVCRRVARWLKGRTVFLEARG